MNMNMNMNMEKWALFASCWKSRQRLFMLSTMFCWTEVLSKKVWEAFWANLRLPRWVLACVILECFVNFLDDPYYEPLPWFMIMQNSGGENFLARKTLANAWHLYYWEEKNFDESEGELSFLNSLKRFVFNDTLTHGW